MNQTIAVLLLATMTGIFNPAAAVDLSICADTVAEIEAGIAAANNPNLEQDRVVIAVAQGEYDLTNSTVLNGIQEFDRKTIFRDLFLLGGYAGPSTCSVRTLQPTNTVFRNTNPLRRLYFAPRKNVTISGIHWRDFEGQIRVQGFHPDVVQQDIEFSYNRITGGRGQVALEAQTNGPLSSIFMRNNLIAGRAAGGDGNAVAIAGGLGPVRALLSNNTITSNAMATTLFLASIEQVNLSNNIVVLNGNNGQGFELSTSNAFNLDAYHNHFGSISSNTVFANNVNNSPANPLFVNAPAFDFRLQSSSTAVNTGLNTPLLSPGATDISNLTRRVGTIDRGAHESLVGEGGEIVVSNINDSGAGSLRAAITLANSTSGINRVVFAIAGVTCPKVITLQSALPLILSSMSIDGKTQVGYVPNTSLSGDNGTRCVALVPANNSISNGFEVPSSATTLRLEVDALAIGGFVGTGIALNGGRAHRIVGSQFGGSIGATSLSGGLVGISVTAADVEIGDADPAERNSIGGYNATGFFTGTAIVLSSDARDARVINNFIGMRPNGSALANTVGVTIQGDLNYLKDNVISYHTELGVRIPSGANNNTLTDNRFGLPPLCLIGSCAAAGNRQAVLIEGLSNQLYRNTIANSDIAAVRVTNNANPLLQNAIYNGAINFPPIDIAGIGFTTNDNDSSPALPLGNRGQNYPNIASVRGGAPGTLVVNGRLESSSGEYLLQFFSANRWLNLALRCEARRFLGSAVVIINNGTASTDGFVDFSRLLPTSNELYITATATRLEQSGGQTFYRDTSEVGMCFDNPMFIDGFESAVD